MLLFETLSVVWTEAGGRTSELESLTFNPLEFPSDLTRFKRSSSSNCESIWAKISLDLSLQVNLCQKLFFLQNMGENMLCTKIVLNVRNNNTDLDDPIVSKKLLLCQNGLQFNRKCLKFIAFVHILRWRHLFLHFL